MAKPPRRPSKRKTDVLRDALADRALVAKLADPRQAGLFDEPLPKWIRPCLPTLVDKPPVGPQWVHEIKWDGYRVSIYADRGREVPFDQLRAEASDELRDGSTEVKFQ